MVFSRPKLEFNFVLVLAYFGTKYNKEDFKWYSNLIDRMKLTNLKSWITALIVGSFFIFFKFLDSLSDPNIHFNSMYVSTVLRSLFFAITINKILIELFVGFIDKVGKTLKTDNDKTKEEIISIFIEEYKKNNNKDENTKTK
jgi:hypothetical protein